MEYPLTLNLDMDDIQKIIKREMQAVMPTHELENIQVNISHGELLSIDVKLTPKR